MCCSKVRSGVLPSTIDDPASEHDDNVLQCVVV